MYDMTRVMSKGYNDSMTPEQRSATLDGLAAQRWQDVDAGQQSYGPTGLANVPNEASQFVKDYAAYYRDPARGYPDRSINSNGSFTATTPLSFMNMPLLTYIAEIAPRPTLLIHGADAHSLYFSETAYAAAAEPKELFVVPEATHTDLYDQLDKIPFDKLEEFFGAGLAA
jgi:fermentation-respiration switch protein FrsA (DUF1100 family)